MEAGGKSYLLHKIFQRTGKSIDEFFEKPPHIQEWMLASMVVQLGEDEKNNRALQKIKRG